MMCASVRVVRASVRVVVLIGVLCELGVWCSGHDILLESRIDVYPQPLSAYACMGIPETTDGKQAPPPAPPAHATVHTVDQSSTGVTERLKWMMALWEEYIVKKTRTAVAPTTATGSGAGATGTASAVGTAAASNT